MTARVLALWLLVVVGSGTAPDLLAQDGGLSLEIGAARAFPPSGTDAAQASYGLVGLRGERWFQGGSGLWGAVYGARALDAGASNWTSADLGGQVWLGLGGRIDLGVGLAGYGFRVSEPYAHRALTAELTPRLRFRMGRTLLILNGVAGWGRSVIEVHQSDTERLQRNRIDRVPLPTTDEPGVRRAQHELWHRGVEPEVRVLFGSAVVGLSAGVFDSPRGLYRSVSATGGGFIGSNLGVTWTVVASVWDTPFGQEMTGGVVFSVPLGGGWSARASGLRTEPNSLVLTRGAGQGGVTVSRQFFAVDAVPARPPVIADLATPGNAVFTISTAEADRVEILGDFTDWEPMPMEHADGAWVVTVPVQPGIYHFGFLVDGEWFLPEQGVEGRVSDDWGRDNGTLVVPEGR